MPDPIAYDFDADAEGWTLVTGGAPTYYSSGGNPGGYFGGADSGSDFWYYRAPAGLLGDMEAYFGGTLSFDLFQSDVTSPLVEDDVILEGGGLVIVATLPAPPVTTWTSYTIDIEVGQFRIGTLSGRIATEAEIRTVLANLQRLDIRGEYRSGADSSGLDNVVLAEGSVDTPLTTARAIISDFDSSTQGWAFREDVANYNWYPAGGNPGGYLEIQDAVSGLVWYYVAPEAYRGNKAPFYGGELSFDLRQTDTSSQFNASDIILRSGTTVLAFDTAVNPGTNWTHYVVALDTSAAWRIGDTAGALATRQQIVDVLANLTALEIRGEYRSGADTGSIDNVIMARPDPSIGGTDFDGDLGDDVLFQRTSDGYTFVINGEGGFQRDFGTKPVGGLVEMADFNGDGKQDLLFDLGGGNLVSYKGEIYGVVNAYGARPGHTLLNVADFDGDGGADLLFQRNSDGYTFVINGEGGFQRDFGTKPVGGLVAVGDFNGDGTADLLFNLGSGNLASYKGETYGLLNNYGTRPGHTLLTVGDFDGDGGDDLLFQRTSDGYTFVINGEGGFQRDFGTKPVGGLVAVGDLNGDGTDDLLFDLGGGNLVSYRGETYGVLNAYGTRPGQTLLALADFDGDGGVDLLFQRTSDGFMTVINGEGGFQRDFGIKPVGGLETIGDFDGDGSADLLIRFADNTVRSYTGDTYGILADYGVRTGQAVQHFDDLLGLSML